MTALLRRDDPNTNVVPASLLRALEREVECAFRDVPVAELRLLRLRFGLGARRHSLRSIAHRLGVTVSAARRLEKRALRTLRGLALPPHLLRTRRTRSPARYPQRESGETAGLVGC